METTLITLYEGQEIRKTLHNGEWWYVVRDVVQVVSSAADVKDYIKKMRKRDPALQENWNRLVVTLPVDTNGGRQKLNCSNMEGLFRIIQAIPASKTESFKEWMSKSLAKNEVATARSDPLI